MKAMTFSRQLRTMQALLALIAALIAVCLVLILATLQWATLAVCAILAASAWPMLHAQWRLFARQRALAEQAQQLRQISQAVPDGVNRLYANAAAGRAVFCSPGGMYDQFSTVEGGDMVDIDRADPGHLVQLLTTAYRIRRSMPLVWRHVWAVEAVKGTDGEFHDRTRPKPGFLAVARSAALNHRTGLLTPDREELAEILRLIESADRTWDFPAGTS